MPDDHHPLPPYPCDGRDPKHECSPPPVLAPPSMYLPPPPPSSSAASHGRGTFVTALIIACSVLTFLALCLFLFLLVRRRRQRRRRQREALLQAALAPAGVPPAAPPEDDGAGINPGDEEVVHHAWHIRTVGLDEAAIESIALTRYRAGDALGASDCTVCLGEFQDGELLRMLPKCAHAFHVQCIDTWLRAHVSCPLCRANVTDPAAEQPDPTPPGAGADAEEEQGAGSIGAPEHEQPDQHVGEHRVQIDQRHQPDIPSEQPRQRPGPRGCSFRRVASMDSPSPAASSEEAPEHEQAGGETKQGAGGAVFCEVSPGSDRLNRAAMKRSLSAGSRWTLLSRQCRAGTSLLPL